MDDFVGMQDVLECWDREMISIMNDGADWVKHTARAQWERAIVFRPAGTTNYRTDSSYFER